MDAALFSPAAERNAEPIWQVLSGYLSHTPEPYVLEVASGSGQHGAAFCQKLSSLRWQPTDISAVAINSIVSQRRAAAKSAPGSDLAARLLEPLMLDVSKTPGGEFKGKGYTHILAVNMIHIAPFACCEGLFRLAGSLLPDEGMVLTYGPYFIEGIETAPSNLAFDQQLKSQNPDFGVRHLRDVSTCADRHGFRLLANHPMPANNNLLVWARSHPSSSP